MAQMANLGNFATKGPIVVSENANFGQFQKGNVADAFLNKTGDIQAVPGAYADLTQATAASNAIIKY